MQQQFSFINHHCGLSNNLSLLLMLSSTEFAADARLPDVQCAGMSKRHGLARAPIPTTVFPYAPHPPLPV
jgi:hypothetical protein